MTCNHLLAVRFDLWAPFGRLSELVDERRLERRVEKRMGSSPLSPTINCGFSNFGIYNGLYRGKVNALGK